MSLFISEGSAVVSGESATAVFSPGPFAGNAKIFASVGQQFSKTEISLAYTNDKPIITFADPLLIGDLTTDGSTELERLDGTTRTFNYKTSTDVTVSGLIPNETYTIRLGSIKNPNIEPIAWYFMDDIVNTNEAPDMYHDHTGIVSGVSLERSTTYRGTGSYQFTDSSSLTIAEQNDLNLVDDFGLNITVKPSSGQSTVELVSKASHYGIRLQQTVGGYIPEFWVNTVSGEQVLVSTAVIAFDEWASVSVKVQSGKLLINVKGTENTVAVLDTITAASSDIVIGGGLDGDVDDLKIFDYKNAAIAGFANRTNEITLIADANGEITAPVASLGNLRTASPLEWFMDAQVYWHKQQDEIEELDTAGGFFLFMTYGMASQSANLMAQVVWDEGQGNSAIVYEFIASTRVVGDIRDIVKYGMKWSFGFASDGEKLTTSLAGIGILTTVTPIADVAVTSLKILMKIAADTPAANMMAELGKKVFEDIGNYSFATLTHYSDTLQYFAGSAFTQKYFKRGLVNNLDDLEAFNTFRKNYGDDYADNLVNRLYSKFDGDFPADVAQEKLKDLLVGLNGVTLAIGKNLSDDGIDGLAALMKVDGIGSARLNKMASYLKPVKSVELESALKAAKGIDELPVKPEGYEKLFNAMSGKNEDYVFGRIQARGALNVMRDVGSDAFGGVANIAKFEMSAPIKVLINGKEKTIQRYVDVVSKEPAKRLEYKAWETEKVTTWGKAHGNKDSSFEFVKDILFDGTPVDFGWVVRGTDLDKVKDVMLQTLGVNPVKGKMTLHPVLKEAIENGTLTDEALDLIIKKVENGSLLREAGS